MFPVVRVVHVWRGSVVFLKPPSRSGLCMSDLEVGLGCCWGDLDMG